MKAPRSLLLEILLVATAALSPCAVAQEAAGEPKLVCDAPAYEFGEREESEVVEHTFTVRNDGAAPLLIRRVRSSCGCTVATLSTRAVPPGGSTEVKARFTLRARRGKQDKSVVVESNDPTNPRFYLWLRGHVTTELAMEPQVVNFSRVSEDAEQFREVRLVSRTPGVSITNVTCHPPQFAAEPVTEEGQPCQVLRVRTVPPLQAGFVRGSATVMTDHPTVPRLKLALYAQVVGEISVLPNRIVLRTGLGRPIAKSILVRPGTVREFVIRSVEVPVEGVETRIHKLPGNTYRIDIVNLPSSPELDGKAVRILTDNESKPELLVPIQVVP